jgi:hypothetical protein
LYSNFIIPGKNKLMHVMHTYLFLLDLTRCANRRVLANISTSGVVNKYGKNHI